MHINSDQNTKLKHIKQLLSSSSARKKHQQYVIESPIFLQDLIKKAPQLIDYIISDAEQNVNDIPCYTAETPLLKSLSSAVFQGLYAVVNQSKNTVPWTDIHNPILLDGIQNPSNFGAIIRNAAAFNHHTIFYTKGTCDPFHPESIRASAGTLWHCNIRPVDETSLPKLNDFQWLSLTPHTTHTLNDYSISTKTGVIFGSEGKGIQSPWISSLSISNCRILHNPDVESLNVAVCSGILLHSLYLATIGYTIK